MDTLNALWEPIVTKTVPDVHTVFFDWLAVNDELFESMFDPEDKEKVLEKLVSYTGPRTASYHWLYAIIFGE